MKNNIKTLRKQRLFSLQQVAISVGVSVATLARWENGTITPPILQLFKLGNVLKGTIQFEVAGGCVNVSSLKAE